MAEPGRPLAASEYWFEDLAAGDQYETGHLTQLEFDVSGGDLRRRPDRGQRTRREGPLVDGDSILTVAFRVVKQDGTVVQEGETTLRARPRRDFGKPLRQNTKKANEINIRTWRNR